MMRAKAIPSGQNLVVMSAGVMQWWAQKSDGQWIAYNTKAIVKNEPTLGPFDTFEEASEAATAWEGEAKPRKKGE